MDDRPPNVEDNPVSSIFKAWGAKRLPDTVTYKKSDTIADPLLPSPKKGIQIPPQDHILLFLVADTINVVT